MLKKFCEFVFILSFSQLVFCYGQESDSIVIDPYFNTDSLKQQNIDTIFPAKNTNMNDSAVSSENEQKPKAMLDAPVDYSAEDSILFSLDNKMIFLYGNAVITYQDMKLKAAYIELNMETNELYATGFPDSAGNIIGYPNFSEGKEVYDAKEMQYNFQTKKGIIKEVRTKQSDGFLHAERTKKHENGEIHMRHGKYTTCDAEHPHFYLALTRAKVIPDDKIVSGPAYMVLEDVPLYFPIIPFGFFPNTKTHSSGIILPEYGEEQIRGFYLRGGGYYFAINDYFDYTITGDYYTAGTWGTSSRLNYKKRYRYSGSMNGTYYSNASGDRDIPGDMKRSNDFSVQWSHRQDPKANPYNNFSASVNFSTNTFNENHTRTADTYLENRKQSSISFTKNWPNKPFNLRAGMNIQQNKLATGGDKIDFQLPSLSFNVAKQYPFRKKNQTNYKWYNNIGIDYQSQLQNNLSTNDSLFFNHLKFKEKDFGFKHSVPLSTSIKFLRFFTFSPGVFYNGMIYTEKIEDRYWVWTDSLKKDGEFIDSVSNGLYYVQGYAPRASISTNPTLYGMYQFKKDGKIEAIRHVFDPNISFSYVPDMKGLVPDYYRTVYNPKTKKTEEYSIFEEGMYNTPTLSGQSGSVSFSLRNNLEMKVKTYSDSAQDTKKIVLIENLNISTSYNVFADSTQRAWSPIDMRSSHSLFNGKLNVSLTAQGSIYAIDSINTVEYIDKYIWESTNKFMRITNAGISLGSSFKSLQGSKTTNTENQPVTDTQDEVIQEITHKEYVDFDIPWDFHINYSLVYSKPYLAQKITQTLSFDGNFSLTPKWKIGFRSGWDFEANKLTYTTVNIYRDLHCWEARFNWVPFGRMKSYGFTIQAKAAILRDLKWDKPKESWYDNR